MREFIGTYNEEWDCNIIMRILATSQHEASYKFGKYLREQDVNVKEFAHTFRVRPIENIKTIE